MHEQGVGVADNLISYDSIRLIFSVADLQGAEENLESHEEEEGAPSAEDETSYPLRCSFTISKVWNFRTFHVAATSKPHAVFCPWRVEHRRGVPRRWVRG